MKKGLILKSLAILFIFAIWNCDNIENLVTEDVLTATSDIYDLVVTAGAGGTAAFSNGEGTMPLYEGITTQITAEASTGYLFSYWEKSSGAGTVSITDHTAASTDVYLLNGSCEIMAFFEIDPDYVPDTQTDPEIKISSGVNISSGDSIEVGTMPGVAMGGSATAVFTISNEGEGELVLSSISKSGNTADFSSSISSFPHTIEPGSASTLTVTFTPQDVGYRTSTMTINSNDTSTPAFNIELNGSGGVWTEKDLLESPSSTYAGSYGYSVDIKTITTVDQQHTYLAVGEPGRNTATNTNVGAVNMYRYNSSTESWDYESGGTWSTSDTDSRIGYSVALCDADDNGEPFMLTGMKEHADTNNSIPAHGGRAMLRRRDTAAGYWRIYDYNSGPERILESSSSLEGSNYFGQAVDINSSWAVVGASVLSATEVGDVYIFNRSSPTGTYYGNYSGVDYTKSTQNTVLQGSTPALGLSNGAEFGWAVSLYEDQLAIGAKSADSNNGRVFFYRYDLVWNNEDFVGPTYTDAAGTYGDNFGFSVALLGDLAVVGIPGYDTTAGNDNSGAVQIYTFDGSEWIAGDVIENPEPDSNGSFGWSVALDDKSLVVGALFNGDSGKIYVYEKRGNNFVYKDGMIHSALSGTYYLGVSVSVDGPFLAAGAYYYNSAKGAAAVWSCE